MRRVPVVVLLLVVLVAGGATGVAARPVAGTGGAVGPVDAHGDAPSVAGFDRGTAGAAGAASDPETVRELLQEFDRTEFRITVGANGSAEWTFRFKQTLANETERGDFRTFAEGFNEGSTGLYTDFQRRARSLTEAGANATGRQMNATAFSKRAFVNSLGNQGIVEMSFRWTAFSVVADDGTLTVADVFEGGLYIRSDQRLVVTAGEGVVFEEVSPAPDSISGDSLAGSDSVTWEGERSFTDERPRIVLAPPAVATASATPTGTDGGGSGEPTTDGTETAGTSPPGEGGATPGDGAGLLPLVGLGAVLLLGLAAAFAYRSGRVGGTAAVEDDDGDGDGSGGTDGAAAEGASSGETADTPDDAPEPSIPDEELLSDEDRVMGLLDERGGRMKQVEIVEETGWSKSKVSMLLSDMEEEGRISKLRVGRENIISKKGMEPEAAGSPFDDED